MLRRVLMSLVVVVTAGSGLLTSTAAHAAGETEWVRRYNGPLNGPDQETAVAVSPDGGTVYVTGGSTGPAASLDYATVAYDSATGTRKWVRRYDGPGHGFDAATALGVSPDGTTVFVTGISNGTVSVDYATVAYDAVTGTRRWLSRYNGPGDRADQAIDLAVSPDGSTVFVTGSSDGQSASVGYATVAYDAATGTRQWVSRHNTRGDDQASALAVSPDGTTVFVTGTHYSSSFNAEYATVAYDAATGTMEWVSRHQSPGGGRGLATALAVSPDGSTVFVTGSGGTTYLTLAYEAGTGSTKWHRRYQRTCCDNQANALAVSPDGATVYVTGESVGSNGVLDYATIAYEAATGARQWVRRYDGPGNGNDIARSVAVSPDGATVFVTGESSGSDSGLDYFTVAYDAATGATSWHRRYNHAGTSEERFPSVAVSPDGTSVFVSGTSEDVTTAQDFATVAYAT